MHGLESIRRAQRAAELDALGSGQPLDGDDAAHVESDVDSLSRGKGRHADVVFLVGRRDRKSVVSGKSVSVSVDLGGRRTIKKTNTRYTLTDTAEANLNKT